MSQKPQEMSILLRQANKKKTEEVAHCLEQASHFWSGKGLGLLKKSDSGGHGFAALSSFLPNNTV